MNEKITKVYEYDHIMESKKWLKEIPYLQFPGDWEIQITPPFSGATIRFRIKKNNVTVSVYLDCYDMLGCYGEPYWEIYPHDGDVFRCPMLDTKSLLKAIDYALNHPQLKE